MKTGILLKSLLDVADMTQKDFAESVFTSPSTISKIITNKHLISPSDEKSFSVKSSRILANSIYESNCYFKFKDIFPVVYDFSSKHDLEQFLLKAFLYAIELDRENSEAYISKNNAGKHYVGKEHIMQMFCIIASDYLRSDRHELLEFYSALPLAIGYSQIGLDEIKIVPPELQREIVFHQLFDPTQCQKGADDCAVDDIYTTFKTEMYTDLYRWQAELDPTKPFLLLKDKYIILFDRQIDGTPHMTFITNKQELENIFDHIARIMSKAERLTFTQDDIEEFLSEEPMSGGRIIDGIINAISGLSGDEPSSDQITEGLRHLLHELVQHETEIFFSADVLKSFIFNSKIFSSLMPVSDIPPQEQINFLNIIRDYMRIYKNAPVRIINISLHCIIAICKDELSLICIINPFSMKVKYHLIDSMSLKEQMDKSNTRSYINIPDFIGNLIDQANDAYPNKR